MFKKLKPMSKKLETSPKDLDKPLLNSSRTSPHPNSPELFSPYVQKPRILPKSLKQVHSPSKKLKPMPKKEETP